MFKLFCMAGAIAAVIGLSFVIDAESRTKREPPLPAKPKASDDVHAPGRVEGASEEIDLRPQLHDRIVEVLVQEGDLVEADDVLLRLDGSAERHACELAEAELEIAASQLERLENGPRPEEIREAQAELRALNARLEGAQDRLKRTGNLRQRNAASEQELAANSADANALKAEADAAQARLDLLEAPPRDDDLRGARGRVAAARARLELARRNLDKTLLRAPCAGQVLKVHSAVGELSGPETAEPAVIIADTRRLHVRAYVDEFDAPRVRLGMGARVAADGLPDRKVQGRVVRLAPRMSQKPLRTDDPLERFDTKVREIWIELDDAAAEAFVVGLPVDVVLDAGEEKASDHRSEAENAGLQAAGPSPPAPRGAVRSVAGRARAVADFPALIPAARKRP